MNACVTTSAAKTPTLITSNTNNLPPVDKRRINQRPGISKNSNIVLT
jgi:hypothetical protein